jgi:hypothetical protein
MAEAVPEGGGECRDEHVIDRHAEDILDQLHVVKAHRLGPRHSFLGREPAFH